MNFEKLNLQKSLLDSIAECGYDEPTPIQRETIPAVLEGRDVLGCAQTGTGKTAAFALPMLQRLCTELKQHTGKRTIRALVLTPTRELALQIYENFVAYGKRTPLRACVIFGGVNQQPQVQQLKSGVDILVATPGRLNDLIGQGFIALDHIEIFVLDEADRMLDMGFIHDVRKVIALLPDKRQTLFFSATMPPEVEKLAMGILTKPVNVKVDPVTSTVDAIDQCVYTVDKVNKKLLLANLLAKPEVESALVFSRTKHGADKVVRDLSKMGVRALAIHGDKSQAARQEALSQFKSGKTRVLIATDIAARGIDIAGLSHVFNYDLPNEPEAYIHRIGRTGRAGLNGVAISFCCIDEMKELYAIEKLIGKHIPRKESAWPMTVFEETVKQPRPPRPGRGGLTVTDVNRDGTAKTTARQGASRAVGRGLVVAGRTGRQEGRSGASVGSDAKHAPRASAKDMSQRAGRASWDRDASRGSQASADKRGASQSRAPRGDAQGAQSRNQPSRTGDSSERPAMRATPLERPTHMAYRAPSQEPRESRRETGETNYVKPRRAPRRPLSTGQDRR